MDIMEGTGWGSDNQLQKCEGIKTWGMRRGSEKRGKGLQQDGERMGKENEALESRRGGGWGEKRQMMTGRW